MNLRPLLMGAYMREFWTACACFALLAVAAAPVDAQCQKCTGSSSCGSSSLRGGCWFFCTSGGSCICTDDACKPKPTKHFEPIKNVGRVSVVAIRAEPQIQLATSCQDRWIGVAFASDKMSFVRAAMQTVVLTPRPVALASFIPISAAPQLASIRRRPTTLHGPGD